jgi:Holliday junction resolvase
MENDSLFPIPPKDEKVSALIGQIIKYIQSHGSYAVRINVAGFYNASEGSWRRSGTERGTADIHACIDGKHVSIEVKGRGDRISEEQEAVKRKVIDAGGTYIIVQQFAQFHGWFHSRTR